MFHPWSDLEYISNLDQILSILKRRSNIDISPLIRSGIYFKPWSDLENITEKIKYKYFKPWSDLEYITEEDQIEIFQTFIRSGVYYRGRSNIDISNLDQIWNILQRKIKCRYFKPWSDLEYITEEDQI